MIMPTTPEGKAKLQHELAKFQAEWALKYVQNLSCPTTGDWENQDNLEILKIMG